MKSLVALLIGFLYVETIKANVLLEIDVSNTSAVIFSSTPAHSLANNSTTTLNDGVYLMDFSTSDTVSTNQDFYGNFSPNDTNLAYNKIFYPYQIGKHIHLSRYVWRAPSYDQQIFSTSARAFTGSSVCNLSELSDYLPETESTGNIIAGSVIIGQWKVIGEINRPIAKIHTAVEGEAVEIEWLSFLGTNYRVEYSTNLVSANWYTLVYSVTGNGSKISVFDSTQHESKRFYRVINQ